jgi:protein TonB
VNLVKGDPILAKPALEAVKQWRYKPTLLNGKPVEVDSTILVEFRAQ